MVCKEGGKVFLEMEFNYKLFCEIVSRRLSFTSIHVKNSRTKWPSSCLTIARIKKQSVHLEKYVEYRIYERMNAIIAIL